MGFSRRGSVFLGDLLEGFFRLLARHHFDMEGFFILLFAS